MSAQLKKWMKAASTAEQKELAKLADTTHAYLYHLSCGLRVADADLAGRLEDAAIKVSKSAKRKLPLLTRKDLSPACAKCPYNKKCKVKDIKNS